MENVTFENNNAVDTGTKFMAKVFGYMFAALLITALVTLGVGYLFTILLPMGKGDVFAQRNTSIYFGILITCFVLMIITSIWFNVSAASGKHTLFVPFAVYAVIMGVLISSFTLFVKPGVLALAFGITCLAFGTMTLIGLLAKRSINALSMVAMGLFSGAAIIALTNLIWFWVSPGTWYVNYLILQAIIFAVVMIITIIDVFNVKQIAARGEANNNVALYCAFTLYIDFILIFLRVLYYVILFSNRN